MSDMTKNFNPLFLNAHPGVREALESGEVFGIPFRLVDGPIVEGDTYMAERNTGLHVFTAKFVDNDPNKRYSGWIVPVEHGYSYDLGECIKIELLDA